MSQPVVHDAQTFRLFIGTDPATGSPFGAFVSRSFNTTREFGEQRVPDIDDPQAVVPILRIPISIDRQITGEGYFYKANHDKLRDLDLDKTATAMVFQLSTNSGANGGGYWGGNFHIQSYNVVGEDGDFIRATLTFVPHGAVPWTAAA